MPGPAVVSYNKQYEEDIKYMALVYDLYLYIELASQCSVLNNLY